MIFLPLGHEFLSEHLAGVWKFSLQIPLKQEKPKLQSESELQKPAASSFLRRQVPNLGTKSGMTKNSILQWLTYFLMMHLLSLLTRRLQSLFFEHGINFGPVQLLGNLQVPKNNNEKLFSISSFLTLPSAPKHF